VFVPAAFAFAHHRDLPSESIRLSHITSAFLKSSRLIVTTPNVEYEFAFCWHFYPILTTGDTKIHRKWVAELRDAIEANS
jgi:hypothetical protein